MMTDKQVNDLTSTPHSSSSPYPHPPSPRICVGKMPPRLPWPDIGHLGKWSVSSYKFGFGPECLTDEDPDTFWQYASISSWMHGWEYLT